MLAVFDGAKAPDFPDSPGLIIRPGLFWRLGRAHHPPNRLDARGRRGETLLMGFFTPLWVTAVVHM